MKPGRVQNALKPFGRAPKCFIILRPDSKIQEILENVGPGLPKIAKLQKPAKLAQNRHPKNRGGETGAPLFGAATASSCQKKSIFGTICILSYTPYARPLSHPSIQFRASLVTSYQANSYQASKLSGNRFPT